MKIKVTNIHQAEIILSFYSIECFTAKNIVIVHSGDYEAAIGLLDDLKPKPPKPKPKKERDPEPHTGRPTFESQGKRRKTKLSVAIDAEAADWLYEQMTSGELISHTLSKLILEHKTLILETERDG